jgi:hypothetical protein
MTMQTVRYRGYFLHLTTEGNRTRCRAQFEGVGISRVFPSIRACKEWLRARDALPMEKREPWEGTA